MITVPLNIGYAGCLRPRFIADADFNYPIVAGLRRREWAMDILSADEGGLVGLPDVAVLEIAAESGRIFDLPRSQYNDCGVLAIHCDEAPSGADYRQATTGRDRAHHKAAIAIVERSGG
jgi:hypothetical protein